MNVSDFMQKSVITVSPDDPVKQVIRIIFNLNINSVPVVEKRKFIGIVTEEDVLKKLFPSVSEFMLDAVSARNFDAMEVNMSHLMSMPVRDIMTVNATTLHPDAPLMKAQSTMLIHKFSHIPIIENDKTLVGLISQGDIFKALVENDIPFDSNEEYHQWLSYHWDLVVPWEKRLSVEIPSLKALFSKHQTERIIDIFSGTGEHVIALAKENYHITGLNSGTLMHRKALEKHKKLSKSLQLRAQFRCGSYPMLLDTTQTLSDAVIILGNALGHLVNDYKIVLQKSFQKLDNNGLLILQISNIDKILKENGRLQNFTIAPSKLSSTNEYAFVQFFDPPPRNESNVTLNMAILQHTRHRWQQKGVNSTPIVYFTPSTITPLLKKTGFKKIEIFGSRYHQPLFTSKFDTKTHDWMNVIAHK